MDLARCLCQSWKKLTKSDIVKVNIDQDEELAKKFGVLSIPTLIFFSNGEEVEKTIGYRQKSQIEEIIKRFI